MDDREKGANPTSTGQETVRVGGGPPSQDTPPTGYAAVPPQQPPQAGGMPPPPPPPPYASQPYGRTPSTPERAQPKRHGVPILGPVLLVVAGVIFLLNNLEILPWGIWGSLWRLWPLILIAIGLDMLFGRRSAVISVIIVLGLLVAGMAWMFAIGGWEGWGVREEATLSVPLDGARSSQVDLNLGAGELRLAALPIGSSLFAEGTLSYPQRGGQPRQDVKTEGDEIVMKLEQRGDGDFPMFIGDDKEVWDLDLSRSVSTTLNLNVGAGQAEADLRDLKVSNLDLDVGLGNATVTLPANAGSTTGRVDVGLGNATIYVPEGVTAVFEADSGLGNVDADDTFTRDGDTFRIEGDPNNPNRLEFVLHVGAGNVDLQTAERLP